MHSNLPLEASSSSSFQSESRLKIVDSFLKLDPKVIQMNPGLLLSTPYLAKILSISNVYQHICNLPGDIVEFGVWYGQNIILCENLRSILEPFNINRRIFGFDTFEGYPAEDSSGYSGTYCLNDGDYDLLKDMASLHQQSNTPPHLIDKITFVKGNINETLCKTEWAPLHFV